jgi:cyclophilin family peptidyl-prolyl cis-trans isomerase
VGTEKRERQKANRALRQQEELKAASRKRGMRIAAIVVGGLVAVFGLVYIATLVTGDDDADVTDTLAPISTETLDTIDTATTLPSDTITSEPTGSDPVSSEPAVAPVASDPASSEPAVDPDTSDPAVAPDADCPPEDGVAEPVGEFDAAPPMCLVDGATYQAVVETNMGEFTVDLDAEAAPLTVNNFVFLARNGFYDETPCHRILPDFVVQCGDPTGTGTGGPGYEFADELPAAGEYQLGSLAMANSGPDTNGSQFFIITGEEGVQLPPSYSLFGQVAEGFDTTVADMAATGTPGAGTPSEPVEILSVRIIQS